jgi:hypothetical protein
MWTPPGGACQCFRRRLFALWALLIGVVAWLVERQDPDDAGRLVMLSAWWVLGASGLYLLLLFAVAYFGDWRAQPRVAR